MRQPKYDRLKRKCRECGRIKDYDEFVNDSTPVCVECAEKRYDVPSGDEIIPESYNDIF